MISRVFYAVAVVAAVLVGCNRQFETRPLASYAIDTLSGSRSFEVEIIYSSGAPNNESSALIYRQYLATVQNGSDTIKILSNSEISLSETNKKFTFSTDTSILNSQANVICNNRYKEVEMMEFPIFVGTLSAN